MKATNHSSGILRSTNPGLRAGAATALAWLILGAASAQALVIPIILWTFEKSAPRAHEAAGIWITNIYPEFGSGTASALHQNATAYSSPVGDGSMHSFSSPQWFVGDFYQFACPTVNATGIGVAWDQVSSATGPGQFQLQYSLDGVNYINFGAPYSVAVNGALSGPTTYWSSETYNLTTHFNEDLSSVPALNNAQVVWFRLTDASASSAGGGILTFSGTSRVDNFTVSGTIRYTGPPPPPGGTTTYGTPLGTNQLNSIPVVPGTFNYSPPAGTVLPAGSNTLTAIFTPNDTNDYPITTNYSTLVVLPAPLLVSANNATRLVGQNNPVFTGTINGLVTGDNITVTYSAPTNNSAGNYAIVPALHDPNGRLSNYAVTINNGTLVVSTVALRPVTLAGWTFALSQPSANLPTNTLYSGIIPEIGNGTASALHQDAASYSSPVGNGSSNSWGAANWSMGDFYQFEFDPDPSNSVTGISVSWEQVSSYTGPGLFQFQYSTDGVTFSNVGAPYTVHANSSLSQQNGGTNYWSSQSYNGSTRYIVNLDVTGMGLTLSNAPTVWFRLTDASTASADGNNYVGPSGASRVANVMVTGLAGTNFSLPCLGCDTTDGTLDAAYGSPLAVQTINSGFGDNMIGDGTSAGGSELDAAFGTIQNGTLYLFVSGNLEDVGNNINIFISDGRPGQSTLNAVSVGNGSWMDLSAMNGSQFSPGFNATYALNINNSSNLITVNQYDLVHGFADSLGIFTVSGGIGNANLNGLCVGFDNLNAAGVNGNSGTAANAAAARAVTTGLELAIPLSFLGNAAHSVDVLVDINGFDDNYLSNQFLPGLAVGTGNLGAVSGGMFDFSGTSNQYVVVMVSTNCPFTNSPANCLNVVCPTNLTVYAPCGSSCVLVSNYPAADATNYCDSNNLTVSYSIELPYCFPVGTTPVQMTVSGSGQTNTCPFMVIVPTNDYNQVIYSDLEMNDATNWTVDNSFGYLNGNPIDYQANFGVNYTSALGVPQDPYSSSTTALQLKVNEISTNQAGVSVSPAFLSLSGNFTMSFDMWLNYNSGGFTTGSTQVGSYGLTPDASQVQGPSGVGDGQLFGEITDTSSTYYRGYNAGSSIGATPFVAGSQSDTASYYTSLFPSVNVPATETALDANQYGSTLAGTVSFQWLRVNVTYNGGVLSESINGNLIASYATVNPGSDIFLGMYDINNGSAGVTGLADQNYVLFDNVVVTIPIQNCSATNGPPCLGYMCPTNLTVYAPCGSTNCVVVSNYPPVFATNYCDPTNLLVTFSPPLPHCFPVGSNWVQMNISGGGQSNYCDFLVTVVSTNCPSSNCLSYLCPSNLTVYAPCGSTNCVIVSNYPPFFATNTCSPGNLVVSFSPQVPYCFPVGTNVVQMNVSGSGQSNYCDFLVTVVSTNCPSSNCLSYLCPSNLTVYAPCGSTNCVVVSNYPPFFATNLCNPGNLVVTFSPSLPHCFPVGTNVVQMNVSGSGQSNYCDFLVTVVSTNCPCTNHTPPMITCPSNIVVTSCTNNAGPNLVPNPGFEIYTNCPTNFSELDFAPPWFQPTEGTPDYFNACADSIPGDMYGVPVNYFGNQTAHGGQAYAGGYMISNDGGFEYREYLEVQLLAPLEAGHTYTVAFFVANSEYDENGINVAIDNVGAYLSVGAETSTSLTNLPVIPQVRNPAGNFLGSGWTLIQGTYIATGGESYLTLGNFYDDANTPTMPVESGSIATAYYYFDDVSVVDTSPCATAGTNGCGTSYSPVDGDNFLITSCTNVTVCYSVTATSPICSNVMVSYTPPPGTTFLPNTTNQVTCIATDCCGNSNSCSFTVTVLSENCCTNRTPPMITCPSNIVVTTACSSVQVFYDPTATSEYCTNVTVVCYPPSGTFFPPGATPVLAVATDCCGNTNQCSFEVVVDETPGCIAGTTWTPQNTLSTNWISIASSADGSKLFAVASGYIPAPGQIFASADYGVTWTQLSSATGPRWQQVACSADGTKVAAVPSPGYIYTSTNSGATWTPQTNSGSLFWGAVASSSDGTVLVAGTSEATNGGFGTGQLYFSSDSGVTWQAQNAYGGWRSIALSSDGSSVIAVGGNGLQSGGAGYAYLYGPATSYQWVQAPIGGTAVACSADGTKLVVASGENMYTSTNSGLGWTTHTILSANGADWTSVASSADGSRLVAVTYESAGGASGYIYTSTDYGTTWTQQSNAADNWEAVASSADASRLAAAPLGDVIYTSDCANLCCVPPPTNMVLWLPFDETNGSTSANLASPANPGTQINHPTPLLGSYVANSLLFDGTNYVTVPDYSGIEIGTNGLTIDAWVEALPFPTNPTNYLILDKRSIPGSSGAGYYLTLSPSLGLAFYMSGQRYTAPITVSTQQWHFVAVSVSQNIDAPYGYFYLDGALVGSFAPTPINFFNTNSLWVGSSPSPGYDFALPWVGALDEVEVYDRALSTNELSGIFSASTAGKCKPCCYLKTLSIVLLSKTSVEVSWGGCGILESASDVEGPWTPIQNAASPYIIPPSGVAMFYRLDCQAP